MRFEKVWIDQCKATKTIKRRFGAKSALDYLIGEKLLKFADAASKDPAFAKEFESARPDQQGRFTIRGLPPGTYVAIAVGYLEPGEERDPEVLEKWRQRGTLFMLSEGETHAVDLRLSGLYASRASDGSDWLAGA